MSEIKLLPKAKSKFKRCLVLVLGGLLMIAFSVAVYRLYGNVFHSEEIKLTVWAVTQGVINVLLSPAKWLAMFKA
nr:MAG TPA: hypothetical protein [Caudoviricetes sp.]